MSSNSAVGQSKDLYSSLFASRMQNLESVTSFLYQQRGLLEQDIHMGERNPPLPVERSNAKLYPQKGVFMGRVNHAKSSRWERSHAHIGHSSEKYEEIYYIPETREFLSVRRSSFTHGTVLAVGTDDKYVGRKKINPEEVAEKVDALELVDLMTQYLRTSAKKRENTPFSEFSETAERSLRKQKVPANWAFRGFSPIIR